MLVVLAIIAALSIAFVNSMGSKSPKAVKTGLQEMKSVLQESRRVAVAGGRDVNMHFFVDATDGKTIHCQTYFTNADGTSDIDTTVTDAGSNPMLTTEVVPIAGLDAVTAMGFTGWSSPLELSNAKFGFASNGSPQLLEDSGKVRNAATGGIWIGVRGLRVNEKGYPYGAVLVNGRGMIMGFYKPDSKLDDTELKWQRMD
jgi:Tfp pilus assembly protein FimT